MGNMCGRCKCRASDIRGKFVGIVRGKDKKCVGGASELCPWKVRGTRLEMRGS